MNANELASPPFPDRRLARRSMVVLSLVGFFLSMDATLTTLLIEPVKRDLALSDMSVGLLQGTAFWLALGLCSLPFGRLIDRCNRTRLLSAGLIVWIIAMTATALARDVLPMIGGRAALGAVAALLIPASLSLVADLYPPEGRSVATSMFVVGQAAGQAVGILAGGLAFDALTHLVARRPDALFGLAPWRFLYISAAATGVVLLLLLASVREPARQERRVGATQLTTALKELWVFRRFLVPLLAAMLFTQITAQVASVWAAPVLMRRFALTPGGFAGWLSAVMLGSGMLGAVAGGRLGEAGRKRLGRGAVLLPAMLAALALAPLSLFAVAPGVPSLAMMLALHIFAGAIVATVGVIAITLNVPNEIRGLALGANTFTVAVFGAATASPAVALLSGLLGGEGELGAAIAGVGISSALLATAAFAIAIRSGSTVPPGQPRPN